MQRYRVRKSFMKKGQNTKNPVVAAMAADAPVHLNGSFHLPGRTIRGFFLNVHKLVKKLKKPLTVLLLQFYFLAVRDFPFAKSVLSLKMEDGLRFKFSVISTERGGLARLFGHLMCCFIQTARCAVRTKYRGGKLTVRACFF